jgi:DNA topoisomerase-3
MLHLVQHFGDRSDHGAPCGVCDVCAPQDCIALTFRAADRAEREAMKKILEELHQHNSKSTGRLHLDTFGQSLERRSFETLLGALVRAGLVNVSDDSFEREGERIRYRRVFLTPQGQRANDATMTSLTIVNESGKKSPGRKRHAARNKKRKHALAEDQAINAPAGLVEALRQWRLKKAKRWGIPAFRIFSDRTLMAIATEIPHDEEALLAVRGMGPTLVRKYGEEILAITTR